MNNSRPKDQYYMRRALALALRGYGRTEPNPIVGAIVVKDGKIVGKGWHQRAGLAHAEVVALDEAGSEARGACLYVTLEPCNHVGRTGACTERILEAGVKRVVYALSDPNPKASGGGEFLRSCRLEVVAGVLEDKVKRALFSWLHFVAHGEFPKIAVATVGIEGKLISYRNRYLDKYFPSSVEPKDLSINFDYLLLVRTTLVGQKAWPKQNVDLDLIDVWKLANNSYSLYRIG